MLSRREILETMAMLQEEKLDIRTLTLGVSLLELRGDSPEELGRRIYEKIVGLAGRLTAVATELEREYGVPIVNRRLAVTPLAMVGGAIGPDGYLMLAAELDRAAAAVGVNFIGGFSALVHKGFNQADSDLVAAIPQALASTERVCSSVNVATTRAGINMEAVARMAAVVGETARRTAEQGGFGCAKLVVFANAPEDNPFMAGAFHGPGEGGTALNVGVSGPGVVKRAIEKAGPVDLSALAEVVKKAAFRITRLGELVGREAARRLGVEFGVVDLSLAPTPSVGDSVAEILEAMGLEMVGGPGSTAALALLNDAVKKGGLMASSSVGGLSGAFIPVSEDIGMIRAVRAGALTLNKLEAMTAVCSVGLDMIALPGDTPEASVAGLIADEMAIGVVNDKTTGVRVIPVPGGREGEIVDYGGLWGSAPVMSIGPFSPAVFVGRGGRIPAPLRSLNN